MKRRNWSDIGLLLTLKVYLDDIKVSKHTPTSIEFKISNFKNLGSDYKGSGLQNYSKLDEFI